MKKLLKVGAFLLAMLVGTGAFAACSDASRYGKRQIGINNFIQKRTKNAQMFGFGVFLFIYNIARAI